MKNMILLALPLLLAGAAPAAGLPGQATVTSTVRFDDLDLSSAEGKAQLERRLSRAVSSMCRPSGRLTLSEGEARNACLETARASAKHSLQIALNGARSRPTDMADAGPVLAFERP